MRTTQRRADLTFGFLVLAILAIALGFRYVVEALPHSVTRDDLRRDLDTSSSTAALLRTVVDLSGRGRLTDTYVRALAEDLDQDLRDDLSHARQGTPAPEARAGFAGYRSGLEELQSLAARRSSPAYEHVSDGATIERLVRLRSGFDALRGRP